MNKTLPDNWWDEGINPILGYKYQPISTTRAARNKNEYPPEDDYKVDDGVIAYFTRQTRNKTDNNNE